MGCFGVYFRAATSMGDSTLTGAMEISKRHDDYARDMLGMHRGRRMQQSA
jgi:hypothetical protein